MRLGGFQGAAIAFANALKALLETRLKAAQRTGRFRMVIMLLQPIQRERRDQRPRQHIRRQHREHHRFGQRREQILGYPAQEEDRDKNDTDG